MFFVCSPIAPHAFGVGVEMRCYDDDNDVDVDDRVESHPSAC